MMIKVFILLGVVIGLLESFNASAQKQTDAATHLVYLSGTGSDNTVDWDFYCSEGRNSGKWTKIPVPSCWELQGFGNYNYGHDPMENRSREYGLYRHRFFVPEAWKNKHINIVFEGVMTDARVRINGRVAGAMHQGAFYEFKYAIDSILNYGFDNLLEVRVDKVSENQSLNFAERQADFWVFGGIFRPVYLELLPLDHISRLAVDARADGQLRADLLVSSNKAQKIEVVLSDLNGTNTRELPVQVAQKNKPYWKVSSIASGIRSWNPEQPVLYNLDVRLLAANGEVLHTVRQRIGFRTIEVRQSDGIYLNGQRIKFKGVNRHSFSPETGRTTCKKLSIEHVRMMKDMNMNAVRMSHYPPDKHFLDVCDSLGLMVIDELCTWHSPKLDTVLGQKLVKEMVVRDVNHPSIVLWANGNETGWNTALDDEYARWDIQKRGVIHPWNIFRKTNTLHYFKYHGLATDGPDGDKVFFPTEFLHGLYDGGHGAGLEDYWMRMWNMPLCAGGFLWDFADEAVVRTDKGNRLDTDGNHAADGIVGPHGEKEGSYFTIKEIWSPIYLEDRYIRPDFNGVFRLENRYHFTNLDACKMVARWIRFDGPDGSTEPEVAVEQEVKLPPLSPGQKGSFKLSLPEGWQHFDALWLSAYGPDSREVFTWSYPVQSPLDLNRKLMPKSDGSALTVSRNDSLITVRGDGFRYCFSASSGLLRYVYKGNQLVPLSNGPVILAQHDSIEFVQVRQSKDTVFVVTKFAASDKSPEWTTYVELSSDSIVWKVEPSGLLHVNVVMKSKKVVKGWKGISFSFPEGQVAAKKWLGDGPYRVWRNRMRGTRWGIWENDWNNTVTGESGYIYPEFKGYFSNVYWVRFEGKQQNGFTVYCHSPRTFLRVFTPEAPEGDPRKRVTPPFPEGDISFLKNIPPIGTKFQSPETMGPQGNPENYFGNTDEPIHIALTFQF